MTNDESFSPGDIITCGRETALVWAVESRILTVLPAEVTRGPSKTWDVELGRVALSSVLSPLRVSIYRKAQWSADDCQIVAHLTPSQETALRLTIRRVAENAQAEASVRHSAIFAACKPSFRSGGRRVGSGASRD